MQLKPHPLRGFLLKLIQLLNLEYMKEVFLSMEAWGGGAGIMQPPIRVNGNWGQQFPQLPQQVPQAPRQPFVQPIVVPNLGAIREAVQELYRPSLKQIGHLKFYKPYPEMIDGENPYPRGYKIPNFSLFSREYGQSILEHVARFSVQCGELTNYENFYHFMLGIQEPHTKLAGNGILSSSGLSLKCASQNCPK